MKYIYSLLIIGVVATISLSIYSFIQAQQADQEITEKSATTEQMPAYHFVLIGEEMDHDYWKLVGEGAQDTEEKYDVAIEYNGPRRSNPDEQLKLLDMAIKSKVDGIIVQALNDDFLPVIDKAVEQGIPVITIDTDAPESRRSAYIGTDNYQAGRQAGEQLLNDLSPDEKVGIITGSFTNDHHKLRVEGFRDVVEEEGVDIVAIEESNISRTTAEGKAYSMLRDHPEITALYGTSALDGIGMVAAIESLDIQDDLYVMAFDTLEENLQLLAQEKIDVLVQQQFYNIGYTSVELMLDVMEGKDVQDTYYTPIDFLKKEDLGDAYD
ncbi:sugar-binding protein [Gracilibacillus phocaeensis]|uniref:sugar-binding protein n=1 Tax=Gracilibacillus phocaeensis TaxID=2042304 RepID=UPI001030C726|nr:sugar-binding protein [Gracilibacillus phocaeensis]